MFLQERRIVAEVGVAAPDVETVARQEDTGHVAKPCVEQAVELFVGDEVVGQRTILGTQLFVGRLAPSGVAGQVELVVMRVRVRANELRPAAMALLLRGSTFTL